MASTFCRLVASSIRDERQAVRKYRRMARMTHNHLLRHLLHDIAHDEMKHYHDFLVIRRLFCR